MSVWIADVFYKINTEFLWIGPLAFFLSILFPFFASDKKTRKTLLWLWVASLCVGGIFAVFTYSRLPKSGMESMFTILVFPIYGPRWALIASTISSSLYLASKRNKINSEKVLLSLYLFGVILCALIIIPMNTTVNKKFENDDSFWSMVHERNLSVLPLDAYNKHVSKKRNNTELFKILSTPEYNRLLSASLLHVLYDIGEDVSGCLKLDEELFLKYLNYESHVFYMADGTPFKSYSRLYSILKNGNISKTILLKALNDPIYMRDYSVYLSVAQNPNTEISGYLLSQETALIEILRDQKKYDRVILEAKKSLAKHSGDEGLLANLFNVGDEEINMSLIQNISTPYAILNSLSRHENSRLAHHAQYAIYKSPKTPLKILRDAYERGDSRVNEALAENPTLPDDLVDALFAGDKNGIIRERLVVGLANRTPQDIEKLKSLIKQMPEHNFYSPHFPALVNREIGLELGNANNFIYYLENTILSDEELMQLLNTSSNSLKLNLAKNKKTDYQILKILALDKSKDVSVSANISLDEIRKATGYSDI